MLLESKLEHNTGCIKMTEVVLKLIIFTSMVNRIINSSRNERVTQQVYDTYLQMLDVCTLRYTAHIEAIVQFLPYSAQQVRCDSLHTRGNSVLQIRYAHGLWWHKHFVLHVTPKEVVTSTWAYLIWRTDLPRLWRPSHLTCWAEYGRNWTIASMCAM